MNDNQSNLTQLKEEVSMLNTEVDNLVIVVNAILDILKETHIK